MVIGDVLIGGVLITGVLIRDATVALSSEATPAVGTGLGAAGIEAGFGASAPTPAATDWRGGFGVEGTRRAGDSAALAFATVFSGRMSRAVVGETSVAT